MILVLLFLGNLNLYCKEGSQQQSNHEKSKEVSYDTMVNESVEADPTLRMEGENIIPDMEKHTDYRLNWLAWLIIGIYGFGMIAIGYYYMRRNKTADDYLLGGRTMKSGIVGISLFATLMSTITYLAVPGEIIKYGPMYFGFVISMPIVYYVVGWLVIPYIMRLKVTSGYEILERRIGSSIRTFSSLIFLVLRLLWMAVIIYATTDKVLIPITGLEPKYAPLLCSILGIVTILYTSMGGLRAVVMTDAIQAFILFGGAIVVMIIITVNLGGFREWWPHHWMEHWAEPVWGFQTSNERTLGWFFLSPLIWYICTNSSDQMSIQRFLSTRDAKAARQVLGTSLIANTIVGLFLGTLGFALLAYFINYPHLLNVNQSVYENADQLLPQFIVTSLPPWASGIVIAGLMAAAMSSLSAGVNSSSAVVSEDLINRFRKVKLSGSANFRLVKIISLCVGIVVVILSLYVYVVPGNLLEITYRVSNLFTAPLFIMFFMAIFIPWATVFGTWLGTLASIFTAIGISFWENIFGVAGPSFLYIMPASLVAGIVIGTLTSLIPVGPKPKPMISKYDS